MHLLFEIVQSGFFDKNSIYTLSSASGATVLVTGVIKYITRLEWKIIPLLVAFSIALTVLLKTKSNEYEDFLLFFLNSFLIYSSALGVNEFTSNKINRGDNTNNATILSGYNKSSKKNRVFFSSWL